MSDDSSVPNIKLSSGGVINRDYLIHAKANFISEEALAEFVEYCGKPLRKSIRYNSLKVTQDEFLNIANKYHWQLTQIPWCNEGFWVDLSKANHDESLGNLPEHIQGLFYIQEASSMLPPFALFDQIEMDLLNDPLVADFAAAPGSKTTQIAASLNNQGIILANELSASRLKGLHGNLVRCGILNVCMSHQDGCNIGSLLPNSFDFVLLDAPCSGEGTIRKDKDALKEWQLDKVESLAKLQKQIIVSAYNALKPGGRLIYSTCTLSPQENQQVVDYLLTQTLATINPLNNLFAGSEKALTEQGSLLVLPQYFDSEGFFIASINKPVNETNNQQPKPVYSTPFTPLAKKQTQLVTYYFKQTFGVDIVPSGYQLLQKDKDIWLFPNNIAALNRAIKINRAGTKIATIFPRNIRSSFEFASCFGHLASKQFVALNQVQASGYYRGENIEVCEGNLLEGEVILMYQGKTLGVGLNKKGKIKNRLPRELVRDNIEFKL